MKPLPLFMSSCSNLLSWISSYLIVAGWPCFVKPSKIPLLSYWINDLILLVPVPSLKLVELCDVVFELVSVVTLFVNVDCWKWFELFFLVRKFLWICHWIRISYQWPWTAIDSSIRGHCFSFRKQQVCDGQIFFLLWDLNWEQFYLLFSLLHKFSMFNFTVILHM